MYGYTIDQYIEKQTMKNKKNLERQIKNLKAQGIEYYNASRLQGIAFNKGLITS